MRPELAIAEHSDEGWLPQDRALRVRVQSLVRAAEDSTQRNDALRLVVRGKSREVYECADAEPTLYLKRGHASRRKGMPFVRPRRGDDPRIEWRNLHYLVDLGIPGAKPVALLLPERRAGVWSLFTEKVAGGDLVTELRNAGSPEARVTCLRSVGDLVRRMSSGRFHHSDFVGKHVFISWLEGLPRASTIDVGRGRIGVRSQRSTIRMAVDLLTTIPDPLLTTDGVLGFLEAAGISGEKAKLAVRRGIIRRRRLRRSRRFLSKEPDRYLVHGYDADGRSRLKPPFKGMGAGTIWAESVRPRGLPGGITTLEGPPDELERVFDTAEQLLRFQLPHRGGVHGIAYHPTEDRALLLIEPVADSSAPPLATFAAASPARLGTILGTLHRAGVLSSGFTLIKGNAVVSDWLLTERPTIVHERRFLAECRAMESALSEAQLAEFREAYREATVSALLAAL